MSLSGRKMGKKRSRGGSRQLQWWLLLMVVVLLLVGVSVLLPQEDSSSERVQSAPVMSEEDKREDVAESNPVEELTRRLKKSLVDYRAGVPGSEDDLIEAANELSTVYIHAKYYNEAITICTQTVTMIEENFGSSSLRLLPTLKLLTEATQLLDKWSDSVGYLTYIESVMRAHYGLTHPESISITLSIMRMYSQLGDIHTANDVYRTNEMLYQEELLALAARKESLIAMEAAASNDEDDVGSSEIVQQIVDVEREMIDLKSALAEMCHMQGTTYRRLFATILEEDKETSDINDIEQEDSLAHVDVVVDDDDEDAGEEFISISQRREERILDVRNKARHFFDKAVMTYEEALQGILGLGNERNKGNPRYIQHVIDAIFKLAQAKQSYAHMKFQLEHLRDDETLNLFKRIVELSRSLSSYQDIIVSNADKELKRGQQALEDAISQQNEDIVKKAEQEEEQLQYAFDAAERQQVAIMTDLAVALNNLGRIHSVRTELDDAEAAIRESIDLRVHVNDISDVAVNPSSSPIAGEIAVAKSSLAKVLHQKGEDEKAQQLFRDALSMAESSHGQHSELYKRVLSISRNIIPQDEAEDELYDYKEI